MLIPDTVGPTMDAESPVNLQHVVGLSLGPQLILARRYRQLTWL